MNRSPVVDRVAVTLWNMERSVIMDREREPSFYGYADGKQEPMPFERQDAEFQRYWRRRARRVLRSVRGRRSYL